MKNVFFVFIALMLNVYVSEAQNDTTNDNWEEAGTVTTLDKSINSNGSAAKILFDNGTAAVRALGLNIKSDPLTLTGTQIGIEATTSSTNAFQTGNASGRLGMSHVYNSDGSFMGVFGIGRATVLEENSSFTSRALGGHFNGGAVYGSPLTLGTGDFQVGGVLGTISGAVNGGTDDAIVAAVIGIDANNGDANSFAGHFTGRGYFSENVGIGTVNPQNELDVCGTIRATEVLVETGWCDYVFDADYNRLSLTEEAEHIQEKGHLAGFESEEEMNGEIQLGDVTKRQQAKIEEMMLHLIELNELVQAQQKEIEALKTKKGKKK